MFFHNYLDYTNSVKEVSMVCGISVDRMLKHKLPFIIKKGHEATTERKSPPFLVIASCPSW